jgi:hypothetical protein
MTEDLYKAQREILVLKQKLDFATRWLMELCDGVETLEEMQDSITEGIGYKPTNDITNGEE